jgi:hypothetical protein
VSDLAHTPSSRLSPAILTLGCVSLLTAVSSAMIYGLLPLYVVHVLGASVATLGLIEGAAEWSAHPSKCAPAR